MTMQNKPLNPDKKFYRDQIITTDDLLTFKTELFGEIKTIFKEMQEHGGKKWLRSSDVRKFLGVSPGTLQNLRIKGHLPYNKVGGVIFYDRQDILRMIESNRIDHSL